MFHDELLPAVSSFDSRRFTRFSPQLLRKRRRCRSGRAASLGFHPGCSRRCCRCRRYGNRHRHGDCCSDPGKAKPGTELRPGKRHRQNTSWWVWDFSPSLFLVIWPRQSLTWGQRSPPEASVSCDFGVAANQLVTQIHDTCFFSAAETVHDSTHLCRSQDDAESAKMFSDVCLKQQLVDVIIWMYWQYIHIWK